MQANTYVKTIEPEMFERFLEAIADHLNLGAPDSIADGFADVETGDVPLTLAVNRAESFAAAKWCVLTPAGLQQHEAFFVRPAGMPARTGLRIGCYPAPLATGFSAADNERRMDEPAWWAEATAAGTPVESDKAPSFAELVAALVGRGKVLSANPALLARLSAREEEANYLLTLLDEQKQQLKQYRARVRAFEATAEVDASVADLDYDEARLTSLEDLPTWSADNHERIVVLPRALNGVKKSLYERPDIVCAAFEALAGVYRDTRLGAATTAELDEALALHGLKLEGSVGQSTAGSHGDDYFVRWEGRRRLLDLHLLKGGGRDERYCMRLYFFWDADSRRVIVGSGVAHLDNSLT